ncbi:Zinc finger SWIM domain-containing protein 3 [Phytophthora citrophthora]|uniref:Zinc finger SWIM domain-containing protein 3 n=1 Tax=Phytophthora citrophthora TaxID=4793 RepID=A0AAD9LSG3_9STRA|nr:Zinc finger SWIM domain-containing protein 3 [Phytophthora citrophthora]
MILFLSRMKNHFSFDREDEKPRRNAMSMTTRSGRAADAPGGTSDVYETLAGGGVSTEESADGDNDDDGQPGDDSDDSVEEVRDSHGGVMVAVEGPDVYHASWEAWLSYFTGYCECTLQVLPVKETMSQVERNKRLLRTKKGADASQLIPQDIEPYQRTYICTHGWRKRKSRSEGSRPRQHIRLTNRPYRFVVQWSVKRKELKVKRGHFVHNHQASARAFATYPSSRDVDRALVSARVDGMLAVGAERSRIYDYLLEHDQNVLQVDVDNLVRAHSASLVGGDDNEATARELASFAAADKENISSVAETAVGETGVISLATAHMRRIFSRFSEILLVDCSHKTNRYNYQLLTFMCMNEICRATFSLEANGDWHMDKAICHFKRSHPTTIKLLRVIIVDKDMNEIRVLEENFPEARVLICHFHVIKYLKEMRSKPEFGKISTDDAGQIDACIHKMVYADSNASYQTAHRALKGLCERIGVSGFFSYFEKNWNDCQYRWVMHRRAYLPHFSNHTNNCLESFFGKLKDGVDRSMAMSHHRVENEYGYRHARIGQFVNSNYDDEIANVLRFTTPYVAGHVEKEYARALDSVDVYNFVRDDQDLHAVHVQGSHKPHQLRDDDWRCTCEFSVSMRLPCRHVITYRKSVSVAGALIPWMRIDERWTNPHRELIKVRQFCYECFGDTSVGGAVRRTRTQAQRYTEAVRATHLIASELENIQANDEFESMLEFVMQQWRNVRQRTKVSISAQATNDDKEEKDELVDEDAQVSSEKAESEVASTVKIKLNPKAREVGRPKLDKKKTCSNEKTGRKWHEASESGRIISGDATLEQVLESLDRDRPGVLECRRLRGGGVQKPKFKRMKNPVLNRDAFYVLPPKLLAACMAILPVANTQDSAISVYDPASQASQPDRLIDTVQMKDFGSFSRQQIEIFKRIDNVKVAVELGIELHVWLTDEGLPTLPSQYHGLAHDVAKNPVLNRDAFYVLPPKLLAACMAILPVANTQDSAISVYDPASQASQPDRLIDTVQMKDFGSFSRQTACSSVLIPWTCARRRFELFYFLKTGRLLADEPEVDTTPPGDDDEDKAPPLSQDQEVDQLPATQVAQ